MRRHVVSLIGVVVVMCGAGLARANTCKAPRVLVVLDKSSSMVTGSVGQQTKWEVAKQALSQVLGTYQTTIDFGLMVFPYPNQCGPGTVTVPMGPNNAQQIISELANPPPAGGNYTPMAQTLGVAAQLPALNDSSYQTNVLLITDGWQWCDPYDPKTRFLPVNAAANLRALGITTYVVGFGDSVDALTLNKMAEAAQTKVKASCDATSDDLYAATNCYYQANNPQQLINALSNIALLVSSEKCDGLDNDCNGLVDDALSRSCSTACGSGVETCSAGSWIGCTAPQPQPEICGDGIDNNCDGQVDEGCGSCQEGETQTCGSDVGQCKKGIRTCSGGAWGPCTGEVTSAVEICDGLDNDCDGTVDEGLIQACSTICGGGSEACIGGSWTQCTAQQPSQEICDGLDNDCDGVVDGPDAYCASGTCMNGVCVAQEVSPPAATGNGCDCQLGSSGSPASNGLLLLGLGLALGLLRRRSHRLRR